MYSIKTPRHIIWIVRKISNNLSVVAWLVLVLVLISICDFPFPHFFSFTESKQIYLINLFHNFFDMNTEEMVEQEQIAKLNLDGNRMLKKGGQR
jgi:hypothetical protein